MFINSCKWYAFTRVGMAMIIAACLTVPICYAGGAATLVPADDRIAPEGSHISEHRKNKINKEVLLFKAKMKQKSENQQQKQSQQKSETPMPEDPKEK